MILLPRSIEQSGPGIDLSHLPEGLSVRMADPGGMKDEGRRRHGSHREKSPALSRRSATISKSGL